MDRHVKIYHKKGYIVAELFFYYDKRNQVTYKTKEYSMYESEDYETGETVYNTYEISGRDDFTHYVTFRQFKTLEEMKQHDIDFVKNELRFNKMGDSRDYDFMYGPEVQQRRYFIGNNHRNEIFGVADFTYNFETNTKEMKFLSGKGFGRDWNLTSDCLETNMNLFAQMFYIDIRDEEWNYYPYDITMVEGW